MSLNLNLSNTLIRAYIPILLLCITIPSYAKDEITFSCSAIGYGYQSKDKSGPWRHDLGRFVWHYHASMLTPKPKFKVDTSDACKPVTIESPKIILDNDKSVYITGHRCGDSSSYFFAVTNIRGINMHYALGYVEDVFRNKEVRVIFNLPHDKKLTLKDKKFQDVYFDCHPS